MPDFARPGKYATCAVALTPVAQGIDRGGPAQTDGYRPVNAIYALAGWRLQKSGQKAPGLEPGDAGSFNYEGWGVSCRA